MTRDKFQIVGDSLTGHALSFDVGTLGVPKQTLDADKLGALVDMANVIYWQGRESALLSYDDRFDLHGAVEALRALAVIVGPTPNGDRYRRCADIVARLLQVQERGV
jgi:hypothetical protein